MLRNWKRAWCALLAMAFVLALAGCSGDRRKPDADITEPMKDEPILPVLKETQGMDHTPVYATVFGDTVLLATYPVVKWQGFKEPECEACSIAQGGSIIRGCEHESETPIVKVVILEALAPDSTREWFSGMTYLAQIEGIEKLDPQYVKDMTNMFRGCDSLQARPHWYRE